MRTPVVVCLFLVALLPTLGSADGPLRRWLRGGDEQTISRSYHVERTIEPQPELRYCVGPDCQTPRASWAQPQPTSAPAIVVQKAPETVLHRSAPAAQTAPIKQSFVGAEELSEAEIESGTRFSRALVKTAIKAQREGKLKRTEVIRLRVAMLSPAFRAQAEELCLVQIASSGEETPFEYADDGTIIRTAIDWEGLAAFLEKVVPLILTLLKAFGLG